MSAVPGAQPPVGPIAQVSGVPSFGQALGMGAGAENALLPGNILGIDPAYGFSIEDFQATLNEQVRAQVTAELLKREEIESTSDYAELLAQQSADVLANKLNEEVADFEGATDEKIAILESALARQQKALENLNADEALSDEANTVENAINILQEAIASQRQKGIDDTVEATEQAADASLRITRSNLQDEVDAHNTAGQDKVEQTKSYLQEEGMAKSDARLQELEQEVDFAEERAELTGDANSQAVEQLRDFWLEWLRQNSQGMQHDIDQLLNWLEQRQQIIAAAATTIPGTTTEGAPGTGSGGTDNQPTEAQLENLAISLAEQLNILTPEMQSDIMNMTYQELLDFVHYLQKEIGYYALGGGFGPGLMVAGENGPELIATGSAGRVYPMDGAYFKNMIPQGAMSGPTNNVDRSINMGGVTFPDPRGVPQVYQRMMENIATRVALRMLRGN